jgi:acetylornithine deacetylase/succinyl-diaminopimelate desuccinylase-like protein
MSDLQSFQQWLVQRVSEPDFREFLADTLLALCCIDSIPGPNIADTARREGEILTLLEQTISRHCLAGRLERTPIPDSISRHPFYTFPHYAGRAAVYSERSNLVYLRDAPPVTGGDRGIAVNAHIDTVAPYLTPHRDGDRVFGRGACDDKGSCVVMVAALRLLRELEQRFEVCPSSDLTFMFAIDEEMGGNGSLALASDERLTQRYGTVVVMECCDGRVHPGGRGAVWYRVEIPNPGSHAQSVSRPAPAGYLHLYNSVVLALEIIREMDREGAAIKAESDHPLFLQTAVQTSPGIFGCFGEHPARVCGSVEFVLTEEGGGTGVRQLESHLNSGLQEYIRRYGDKSAEGGSGGSTANLQRHYDLHPTTSPGEIELRVHGLSGHMGALYQNDNALIKAAYLLKDVEFASFKGDGKWGIRLINGDDLSPLVLEGGQGFVPSHSMEQIKSRLSEAVQRAYRRYARYTWKRMPYFRDTNPRLSFSKLHNEAYATDPDSQAVSEAVLAAEAAGIEVQRPALGWEVSSDARIFAHLRPDLAVFTTGPGKLALAHSDQEQITIPELSASALMLTLFLLRFGGFHGSPSGKALERP